MNKSILRLEEAIRTVIKAQDEGYKGFEVLISECGSSSRLVIVYPRDDFEEGSDYEFVYALDERRDEVLSLKKGQAMYFQPNRDDETSKGIITRIL